MRLIYSLTLPAVVVLVLFSETILVFLFGSEFRQAGPVLTILCFRTGINAMAGPVGLMLNMLGHERETLRGVRLSLLANVVLAVVLVPSFGAIGAAVASTCATIVFNLLLLKKLHALEGFSSLPLLYKPRYDKT
jgi:O-antigen/teichoic acid export membrane protein